jgi:hypothetical protein
MKRTLASVMFVGLITAGAGAFAQDTRMPDPAPDQEQYTQDRYSTPAPDESNRPMTATRSSKHEQMKDCVAREQADNSSMSRSDAKKACHDALKAQRDERRDDERNNPDNEAQPPH